MPFQAPASWDLHLGSRDTEMVDTSDAGDKNDEEIMLLAAMEGAYYKYVCVDPS